MTRLSAHIGYLYVDLPLADRPAAAARDGFTAIEHPAPFAVPATEMRQRLDDLGLSFAQITTGMGDPERGEKGLASLPGRETAFREGLLRAIDYAVVVGCPYVHPMAGVPEPGKGQDTYLYNMALTLELAQRAGLRVLVEAITIPGYAIDTLAKATRMQDWFEGGIDLLFDTYHARVMGLDPAAWLEDNLSRVGHVHIADHPGRHEPGTGSIDFAPVLKTLRQGGYRGAVGFEYIPSTSTSATTGFLPEWKDLLGASEDSAISGETK